MKFTWYMCVGEETVNYSMSHRSYTIKIVVPQLDSNYYNHYQNLIVNDEIVKRVSNRLPRGSIRVWVLKSNPVNKAQLLQAPAENIVAAPSQSKLQWRERNGHRLRRFQFNLTTQITSAASRTWKFSLSVCRELSQLRDIIIQITKKYFDLRASRKFIFNMNSIICIP